MDQNQLDAFELATSGTSMGALNLIIASVIVMIFFIWAAWNIWQHGKSWMVGDMDLHQLMWSSLRVALIVTIITAWIRP